MQTIIFGNRDLAELTEYYLRHDSDNRPVALCVDNQYLDRSTYNGLPVIAMEEVTKSFPPQSHNFIVPIANNRLRAIKTKIVTGLGYSLTNYISSKAINFGTIGNNCLILENNVIQPFVIIGNNTILWSGNHIGHHTTIGNNVFIASHVVVSGNCKIDDYCWLGVNATIRDRIHLHEDVFIAMGAKVIKDVPTNGRYY